MMSCNQQGPQQGQHRESGSGGHRVHQETHFRYTPVKAGKSQAEGSV